jgi:hypothetical protein
MACWRGNAAVRGAAEQRRKLFNELMWLRRRLPDHATAKRGRQLHTRDAATGHNPGDMEGAVAQERSLGAYAYRLRFRLFTGARWISGEVTTTQRRLLDFLNMDDHQLLAEEASVRTQGDVVAGPMPVGDALVNATAVIFAEPLEDSQELPRPNDPLMFVPKTPKRAKLALGPYEITGDVYVTEGGTAMGVLLGGRFRFVPVGKAVVRRIDEPSFLEEHPILFVNRDRIEYFSPLGT